MNQLNVLRIDASARGEGSVSRALTDHLVSALHDAGAAIEVRDLAAAPPSFVDAAFVDANFTAPDARTDPQHAALAESDVLVDELAAADLLVIGTPIYNFGVPAALKAWVDKVARVHRTFRYSSDGPIGLLNNTRAVVVLASGGTAIGSDIDFASGYLRHILGFMGIADVTFVDGTRPDDAKLATARGQLETFAQQAQPEAA